MKKYKKYLFFDIESCNGRTHTASICSFGYYLTDTNFNVIKNGDILINPPFKFEKRLIRDYLQYNEEVFRSAPEFKKVYSQIKELFKDDVLAIGFEIKNDIKYLDSACKENKLDCFEFDFFDIKYLDIVKTKNFLLNKSLQNHVASYNIDICEFHAHRSDDDAKMTMIFAREFLKNENKDLSTFLEENQISIGKYRKNEYKDIHIYPAYNLDTEYELSLKLKTKIILNYIIELNSNLDISIDPKNKKPIYMKIKIMARDMKLLAKTLKYIYLNDEYVIDLINLVDKIYDTNSRLNKSLSSVAKSTLKKGAKFINVETINEIKNQEVKNDIFKDYFEYEVDRIFSEFIYSKSK